MGHPNRPIGHLCRKTKNLDVSGTVSGKAESRKLKAESGIFGSCLSRKELATVREFLGFLNFPFHPSPRDYKKPCFVFVKIPMIS